jgi:hypothetical protein
MHCNRVDYDAAYVGTATSASTLLFHRTLFLHRSLPILKSANEKAMRKCRINFQTTEQKSQSESINLNRDSVIVGFCPLKLILVANIAHTEVPVQHYPMLRTYAPVSSAMIRCSPYNKRNKRKPNVKKHFGLGNIPRWTLYPAELRAYLIHGQPIMIQSTSTCGINS